jgi:hypothetical protein
MLIYMAMTAALCAPGRVRFEDAEALAIAAAPTITAEGRARGSKPIVKESEKTSRGWAFRIGATHPCAPGLDACSSLLGYYSVDTHTLRVVDDTADQPVSSDEVETLAQSIRKSRCTPSPPR